MQPKNMHIGCGLVCLQACYNSTILAPAWTLVSAAKLKGRRAQQGKTGTMSSCPFVLTQTICRSRYPVRFALRPCQSYILPVTRKFVSCPCGRSACWVQDTATSLSMCMQHAFLNSDTLPEFIARLVQSLETTARATGKPQSDNREECKVKLKLSSKHSLAYLRQLERHSLGGSNCRGGSSLQTLPNWSGQGLVQAVIARTYPERPGSKISGRDFDSVSFSDLLIECLWWMDVIL